MKKTFKKLTALFVVSLLLLVSVPVQSFAAFDAVKIPVIKSIEISEESRSVSLKELDNYYTYIFEQLEKHGLSMEKFKEEFPSLYDYALNFYLSSSNFGYIFDVTLSSGKEYSLSADDASVELNKLYSLEVDSYITYETYLSAKESGADEIEIEINGCLYNNLTYDYCDSTGYVTKCTLPLTEMVVKSITPVSGISNKIYLDANYIDIDGAEFLIEYADGTVVTDKVSYNAASDFNLYVPLENYSLDGNDFYVYSDSYYDEASDETIAEYRFEYLDATCSYPAAFAENSLFKSVKITDCVFDAGTAVLSSISYELTYEDGRVVSFAKSFTEEESVNMALGQRINVLDGYVVSVYLTLGDYDVTNDTISADAYNIDMYVGNNSDSYKIDNPHKDIMNGPLNVAYFFISLFTRIQDFFYDLFDAIFFTF